MTTSSIPAISARSANASVSRESLSTVWCGPPATSHASAAVGRSGCGRHSARATGSFGKGRSGVFQLDLVDEQAEAVAEVDKCHYHRRPTARGEDEPDRVIPAADRERVDLT